MHSQPTTSPRSHRPRPAIHRSSIKEKFDLTPKKNTMGGSESKTIETDGAVNNNLVISEPVALQSELLWMILIILILQIIQAVVKITNLYRHSIKKKYINNVQNQPIV
jgi:hypothetical protein